MRHNTTHQVLDHYIYMKVNDGQRLVDHLPLVVRVLMLLIPDNKGYRSYIRSNIMQMLILAYQEQENTVAWRMLIDDASTFNEEIGEMSFSVLSRCVIGDTNTNSHKHLSDMYALIPAFYALSNDIRNDVNKHGPKVSWRRFVKPGGEEVKAVEAFLKTRIRQASHNRLMVYDGSSAAYKSAANAGSRMQHPPDRAPLWRNDIRATLETDIKASKRLFVTHFMHLFTEVWPEMKAEVQGGEIIPGDLPAGDLAAIQQEYDAKMNVAQHEEMEQKIAAHADMADAEDFDDGENGADDLSDASTKSIEGAHSKEHKRADVVSDPDEDEDNMPDPENNDNDDEAVPAEEEAAGADNHRVWGGHEEIDDGNILQRRPRERKGRGEKRLLQQMNAYGYVDG
jgi:hypothetical protein